MFEDELAGPQSPLPGTTGKSAVAEGTPTPLMEAPPPVPTSAPIDPRLCRLCLVAAIIIAFGDKALLFM
jgi:hypothetical protein